MRNLCIPVENHPLAQNKTIRMEELEEYPCLAFDQGDNPSFFLAEEVMSTYDYKRVHPGQ